MSWGSDAVGWHSEIANQFDQRYRESPKSFRERFAVWCDLIAKYGGPTVCALDAGCGSGVFTVVAARTCSSVLAFDASPEMLALADQKRRTLHTSNVELLNARLPELNFLGDRQFGLIMSSSVLEYMENIWQTIDALAVHLIPGGVLLVSLPNGASLYRQAERLSYKLTQRPRYFANVKHIPKMAVIVEGLQRRGFVVEERRYYAPTPGFSTLGRWVGLARYSDNLFVIAARKLTHT